MGKSRLRDCLPMKRPFHALEYGWYRAVIVHASSMRTMKTPFNVRGGESTPRDHQELLRISSSPSASSVDSVSDYGDWLA